MEETPKQYDLRYLFFVTTCVAVGLGVALQAGFHPGARAIGLGIVAYWIAKAFFVASTRLPKVWKEIVFLIGLPFFVAAMYCILTGVMGLLVDLGRNLFVMGDYLFLGR